MGQMTPSLVSQVCGQALESLWCTEMGELTKGSCPLKPRRYYCCYLADTYIQSILQVHLNRGRPPPGSYNSLYTTCPCFSPLHYLLTRPHVPQERISGNIEHVHVSNTPTPTAIAAHLQWLITLKCTFPPLSGEVRMHTLHGWTSVHCDFHLFFLRAKNHAEVTLMDNVSAFQNYKNRGINHP